MIIISKYIYLYHIVYDLYKVLAIYNNFFCNLIYKNNLSSNTICIWSDTIEKNTIGIKSYGSRKKTIEDKYQH